jgi:hypothetical protein
MPFLKRIGTGVTGLTVSKQRRNYKQDLLQLRFLMQKQGQEH